MRHTCERYPFRFKCLVAFTFTAHLAEAERIKKAVAEENAALVEKDIMFLTISYVFMSYI